MFDSETLFHTKQWKMVEPVWNCRGWDSEKEIERERKSQQNENNYCMKFEMVKWPFLFDQTLTQISFDSVDAQNRSVTVIFHVSYAS